MHLLAVFGLLALGHGTATAPGAAGDARAGVVGGQPPVAEYHYGYRYHGAYLVRPTDGSPQEL